MKKARILLPVLLSALLLSACGETQITSTTIQIDQSGSITHTIIDSFQESYYDVSEMEEMAGKEAKEFNDSHGGDAVSVESVALEGSDVRLVMKYKDATSYSAFNSETLFFGTVEDAVNAGYDLDLSLIDLKDNTQYITRDEILAQGDKHIIITSESVHFITPSNLAYVSEGVILSSSSRKEADTVPEDAYCYILLK
ncbi:MAG: hypothetical protein K5682_04760 [Lachnospiraceae bacterium]|nr:hypothetical protein [Lachnospiraceae bacterium]